MANTGRERMSAVNTKSWLSVRQEKRFCLTSRGRGLHEESLCLVIQFQFVLYEGVNLQAVPTVSQNSSPDCPDLSLQIPRTSLSTVGSRAFSVFRPSTWNDLPLPLIQV